MAIVKVGWSGGKDSTCSVLLHLEQGDYVKAVCYIPMFTKDIPLITKKHYDFIMNTADRLRSMSAEVYIVSGMTYYDFVKKRSTRGKHKGKIFGFPCIAVGKCNFKRDSKEKAVEECDVGYYDYLDLGIAYDESDRQKQLNEKMRSILCEKHFTEDMARLKCIEIGMLSPHYATQKRDGCALCPNARRSEINQWLADFPNAIPLLIELQDLVKKERPELAPLRNYEWFIDTDQIKIDI